MDTKSINFLKDQSHLFVYLICIIIFFVFTVGMVAAYVLDDSVLNKENKVNINSSNFFKRFGDFLQNEIPEANNHQLDLSKDKKRDLHESRLLDEDDEEQIEKTILDNNEMETELKSVSDEQSLEEAKKASNENGNIPLLQNDNKESGNIPLIPGGSLPQIPGTSGASGADGNKEGGGLPFVQGGNFQFPGGLGGLGQGASQTPKLVWGGFFFVETPMPGASMANIANMASLMQNGQQMIPGGLPNQMVPIPGAG